MYTELPPLIGQCWIRSYDREFQKNVQLTVAMCVLKKPLQFQNLFPGGIRSRHPKTSVYVGGDDNSGPSHQRAVC
jgi:hypothetical protein